ncbi:MAG: HEAT repeat domain-containing protein [Dehalococcoidales bacterium]|nr:MAG: HEAT repeat domain-containing protein [Dehalococcoidales bacterium]
MEPDIPQPVDEIVTELADNDQPLLNSRLAGLSNLSSEDLEVFKNVWITIAPERRRQIIHRLVELAEDNIVLNFDAILRHCLEDHDKEVKSQAIKGLWENEEPSLINPLVNLLERDSSEKVQVAATEALGKFAMLAEHEKLRPEYTTTIRNALLGVINDKNRTLEVKRRALEAVSPFSLQQVRAAITEAYNSPDFKLRVSAIYAMGRNCDPSWLDILLKELTSNYTEARYEAVIACGELEEETAVPYLIILVDDTDIDVQMAAIQALGKIGGTKAKECLEQLLDNTSEAIRETTEQALDELSATEGPLPI